MYLLGYDLGSSSIKAALVEAATGRTLATAQHPDREMSIHAPQPGWAEQDPADWWEAVGAATRKLLDKTRIAPADISAIGIAYQMHGLVAVGKQGQVLRPAIIWCDSRAVSIGNQAFEALGADFCLRNYLNSPGNFTASKLRWVRENEPAVFEQIDKIMLPGDYIAYRLTGEICTTATGLSEGVFWDFEQNGPAEKLLEHYEIPRAMLPRVVPVFAQQGKTTAEAASALGLRAGIPVGYRAGDQPNNALSLNVLQPGEVAATGGTSGVVYAVSERPVYDPQQRVNGFAHVNYSPENPLTGVLLCINGAGIQYNWVRRNLGDNTLTYNQMEQLASSVAIGAEGLSILPFGNGAERMLANRNLGAQVSGLDFNRHERRHFYRAALEGVAFAFVHGMEAMREMGIPIRRLRVGNDNLFQSAIFSDTIATLVGAEIELIATTGAIGAAKAAGVSVGIFGSVEEAMQGGEVVGTFEPKAEAAAFKTAYERWANLLKISQ
jgi:xylulokinase